MKTAILICVLLLLSACKGDVFDIMNPERQRAPTSVVHKWTPYQDGQQESRPSWVELF